MAIFGVTNREALDPRFKVIGKLRKGGPKQNGQFGKDLEWFRFTSDKDEVVKAFRQAYGEEPASMEVYFPYPSLEAVFPTFRETYGQNHLLKEQCDGMHIIQWQDGYKMARGHRLCEKKCKDTESRPPCPDCPLKPIGRLSVILLPLLRAGIVGTVTAETHGWHDILGIANQLVQYEPLTGRAFRVYREEETIGAPNKKTNKRMAITKWMVRIEPTQETALMLIGDAQRRARAALLGGGTVDAIPQLEAENVEPEYVEDGAGGHIPYDDELPDENEPPEPEAPPPDAQARPDFSEWKSGKWTTFCTLAVERFGCFTETSAVWGLLTSMHENPPAVSYDVAWATCEEHDASAQS